MTFERSDEVPLCLVVWSPVTAYLMNQLMCDTECSESHVCPQDLVRCNHASCLKNLSSLLIRIYYQVFFFNKNLVLHNCSKCVNILISLSTSFRLLTISYQCISELGNNNVLPCNQSNVTFNHPDTTYFVTNFKELGDLPNTVIHKVGDIIPLGGVVLEKWRGVEVTSVVTGVHCGEVRSAIWKNFKNSVS